jgi:acyl-[acyl-carrier-protein]-phospholipid O-acyltransferase/long-chain-fatty-acid--[acyl-carrier-protein] ligase
MLQSLIRVLLRMLYRLEVHGEAPRSGRGLVIANHQSFLDAPILWSMLPRDALWLVHTQVMEQWVFRFLLKAADHIVIDVTKPLGVKEAMAALDRGRLVVIFPEGRVTVTGALMKIYDGPAFIAAKTEAPVTVAVIDGAARARGFTRMRGDYPVAWLPKVRVTWSGPEVIRMPEARTGRERRRAASEAMRRLLQRSMCLAKRKRSLFEAFLEAVDMFGRGRDMVEDSGGTRMTYGRLLRGALALGRLTARFTSEGENVGVLMPNAAAALALVLGLMSRRRVPAMLNFTSGVEGMQSALRAAQVKTVITSRTFLERAKLEETASRLEGVRLVLLEDLRQQLTAGDKLWLLLFALRAPRLASKRAAPDEPAAVLFTSGSEGKPKGVVLSHWSILSDIEQALAVLDVSPADKIFSAMPVFHSFGLMAGFLLPVVSGIRVYLYPTPLHYAVIPELYYDRDATVMFATPTFLKHYAKRAHPYDLRRTRLLVAGAEKLTAEVEQTYFDKFGLRIYEGYGATECSPVISVCTPMRARRGTVGEPLPLMETRLEPVEGLDEGGLLHVRGPNVMLGYVRESRPGVLEPPESRFGPGWYATGDLAVIEDGFIRLLGRQKRFAKVAGEMISLELPERIAERASPKHQHAAVARPDAARGEMVVLATEDASLQREALQAAAREMGAPELALPRRIVVVDKLPLLGTGKLDYPTIARMVEERLGGNKS